VIDARRDLLHLIHNQRRTLRKDRRFRPPALSLADSGRSVDILAHIDQLAVSEKPDRAVFCPCGCGALCHSRTMFSSSHVRRGVKRPFWPRRWSSDCSRIPIEIVPGSAGQLYVECPSSPSRIAGISSIV